MSFFASVTVGCSGGIMNRESFIHQIKQCMRNVTGRYYPAVDLSKMTDDGLIQFAEMVSDLLAVRGETRVGKIIPGTKLPPGPIH